MHRPLLAVIAALLLAQPGLAQDPVTTVFTYQAELRQAGAPVTVPVDLRFRLYDTATLGNQVGPQLATTLTPANGRFTTDLNFGAVFAGQNRWLEVDVRLTGGPVFTTLTPRQPLFATPNASFALTAAAATTATNASQLNGQSPAFYLNASNFTAGTLPPGLLGGTYTGLLSFTNPANTFTGIGTSLTSLNATNLSTGTLSDARLSANIARLNAANTFTDTNKFSGVVHSMTSGYRFPDNTVQTTAALDPGDLGFTSGYPAGTTLKVTINNILFPTARMIGFWRINRPTTGGPQWSAPPVLRRPRTSDNTWFDWVQSNSTLAALRITITIPGGATVDYDLPTGRVSSYRLLTADDGLPFEEVTYICGNASLPSNISTLSGSPTGVLEPTIAPRLGESTGTAATYRPVWNNVRSDVVRIVGNPVFIVPIDPSSGLQTGQVGSATVTVRANALADSLNLDGSPSTRPFRLVLHPAAGADIDLTNNVPGTITSTIIRLADDGLPVEEYEITFPFNPPP
jgi:hypothetical protein